MSQMKRVVLPILEEIAAQPGSRMEIHTRVGESLNVSGDSLSVSLVISSLPA